MPACEGRRDSRVGKNNLDKLESDLKRYLSAFWGYETKDALDG